MNQDRQCIQLFQMMVIIAVLALSACRDDPGGSPPNTPLATGPTALALPEGTAKVLRLVPDATVEIEVWVENPSRKVDERTVTVSPSDNKVDSFSVKIPDGVQNIWIKQFIRDPRFQRVEIAHTEVLTADIRRDGTVNPTLNFSHTKLVYPLPDEDSDGYPNVVELQARSDPRNSIDHPSLPLAAQLKSFTITDGKLKPAFDSSHGYYIVDVSADSTEVQVSALPDRSGAVVTIQQQAVAPNTPWTVPLNPSGTTLLTVNVTNGTDSADYYFVFLHGPIELRAVPANESVTLDWTSTSMGQQFNLYRSSDPNCNWSNYTACQDGDLETKVTRPHKVRGLVNGRGYYFQLETTLVDSRPVLSNKVGVRPDSVTTDCCVKAIAIDQKNETVYLGGSFSRIGVRTGSGVLVEPAGDRSQANFPTFHGDIWAAVGDGEDGWFVAGSFTRVGNREQRYLAHIKASGDLDENWPVVIEDDPSTPYYSGVWALTRLDTTLYFAGDFVSVNGVKRNGFAAVDLNGQIREQWNPPAMDQPFNSLVNIPSLAAVEKSVFIRGDFSSFDGGRERRNSLAAFDAQTGSLLPWNPSVNGRVSALLPFRGRLYISGTFTMVNDTTRSGLAAFDLADGRLVENWQASVDGGVEALAALNDVLYVAGGFNRINGAERSGLAALTLNGTPQVLSWNPKVSAYYARHIVAVGDRIYVTGEFEYVGGSRRLNQLVSLPSDVNFAGNPSSILEADALINAMVPSDSAVFVGGAFTILGGDRRTKLAAIRTDGEILSWSPSVSGSEIHTIAADDDRVYVGGNFYTANPTSVRNLAVFDKAGVLVPNTPTADGAVRAMAVNDMRVYIAGEFTRLGDFATEGVGALFRNGSLDSSFSTSRGPSDVFRGVLDRGSTLLLTGREEGNLAKIWSVGASGGPVNEILRNFRDGRAGFGPIVTSALDSFVGGDFSHPVNGEARTDLLRLDNADTPTPWKLNADGEVEALTLSGSTLYIGGRFTRLGETARNNLAAAKIEANDGKPLDWDYSTDGNVSALAVWDKTVFAGGRFNRVNGERTGSFVMLPRHQ